MIRPTRLGGVAQHANSNNGNSNSNSNTNKMYVMDDEVTMLSMKNFRQHDPPSLWKRLGGGTTVIMALLGLVIGFLMGFDQASNHTQPKAPTTVMTESTNGAMVRYNSMTTPIELLGLLRKTRLTLIQKLHDEYGDYAHVLLEKANLEKVFHLSAGSKSRYHRRIIQKILQKQLSPKESKTFTWVTAGDVHAAGFGNDPGHSYTSMLDDTARQAFSAVGLELVTQNHGLYNVPSAPALALCMTSVFGADIDILSWDFSLSDGDLRYRAALFGMRATMHPTKPLMLMIDTRDDDRWKKFFWTEGKVGVGLMDTKSISELAQQHFPDSRRVTHPEQLPPALSYLQCEGVVEGQCNKPTTHNTCKNANDAGALCRTHKFIMTDSCDMSRYQSDWNHGWKDHRLKGRLLGLFLVQLLQGALLEMDEATQEMIHLPANERREALLKQYQQYDEQDNFVMSNSVVSSNIVGRYSDRMADLTIPLFQRPSTCLLPISAHAEESGGHEIPKRRKGSIRRRLQVVGAVPPTTTNDTISTQPVEATDSTTAPANETIAPHPMVAGIGAIVTDSQQAIVADTAAGDNATTLQQEPPDAQVNIQADGAVVGDAPGGNVTIVQQQPLPEAQVDIQADTAGGVVVADAAAQQPVVALEGNAAISVTPVDIQGAGTNEVIVVDATPAHDETPLPKAGPASQNAALQVVLGAEQVNAPDVPEAVAAAAAAAAAAEESNSQVIEADAAPASEVQTDTVADTTAAVVAPEVVVEVQTEASPENATVEAAAAAAAANEVSVKSDQKLNVENAKEEAREESTTTPESCAKLGFSKKDTLAVIKGGRDGFAVEIDVSEDAFLVACFRSCTAGNCVRPLDGLDSVKISDGNIVIEVDGMPVIGSREIDSCHFLESREYGGFLWKSKHDKFRIKFQTKEKGSDLLLYSVLAL